MSVKTLTAAMNYQGMSLDVDYEYTNHFSKRSQQRAITKEEIKYALCEGKEIEKQGFLFYHSW